MADRLFGFEPIAPQGGEDGAKPTPPQPPPRRRSSAELLYVGTRYSLAHGRDYFAILLRRAPRWRPPLYVFPRDDAGWEQAWQEFSRMEPSPAEVARRAARGIWGRRAAAAASDDQEDGEERSS